MNSRRKETRPASAVTQDPAKHAEVPVWCDTETFVEWLRSQSEVRINELTEHRKNLTSAMSQAMLRGELDKMAKYREAIIDTLGLDDRVARFVRGEELAGATDSIHVPLGDEYGFGAAKIDRILADLPQISESLMGPWQYDLVPTSSTELFEAVGAAETATGDRRYTAAVGYLALSVSLLGDVKQPFGADIFLTRIDLTGSDPAATA